MYEIKNKFGATLYSTTDSMSACGFYHYFTKGNRYSEGYAEVWYNGACIFKTN